MIGVGYAYLFDASPYAIYACIESKTFGANFYYVNRDLWSIGLAGGHHFSIPAGSVGFMPYIKVGMAYVFRGPSILDDPNKEKDPDDKEPSRSTYFFTNLIAMPVTINFGLKFTTAAVPGLFFDAGFQGNILMFDIMSEVKGNFKTGLYISAGYAF